MSYFCKSSVSSLRIPDDSDFALDLCSVDLQQADRETESRKRVEELIVQFSRTKPVQETAEKVIPATLPAQLGSLQRNVSPFMTVYPILLRRSYLNFKRSPNLVLARIMQVSGYGIILALFYSRLGNDYIGVQNRVGYIHQITSLVFIGMIVSPRESRTNEE